MISALLSLIMPSPASAAVRAVKPNPYAPKLANQSAIATDQAVAGILQPWVATGSEADYPDEQGSGDANHGAALSQFLPGRSLPPSMFAPNTPETDLYGIGEGSGVGDGTGDQTGPYKGWVNLRGRTGWGQSQRGTPQAIPGTLLDPRARTPLPKDVAQAFVAANAGHTRLEDVFSGD